ncbi:hypothetical protein [Nostoc sp.]
MKTSTPRVPLSFAFSGEVRYARGDRHSRSNQFIDINFDIKTGNYRQSITK